MRGMLRRFAWQFKLALVVGAILGVLLVIIFVVLQVTETQERAGIRNRFGKAIPAMCENMDRERPLASQTGSEEQLKMVILTGEGLYHDWQDEVQPVHKARDSGDLNTVICVENDTKVVEECEYGDADKIAFTVKRHQRTARVIMLDARSDSLIGEFVVAGDPPGECPTEISGSTGIYGPDVPYSRFMAALAELLND